MQAKSEGTNNLFSLEKSRSGYTFHFTDSNLYQVFKKYMNSTMIRSHNAHTGGFESMSLTDYVAKFDETHKQVQLEHKIGVENIIGKFFLETNLNWPEELGAQSFMPAYKQPLYMVYGDDEYRKGVLEVFLGAVYRALISADAMEEMNSYVVPPQSNVKKIAPLIIQDGRSFDNHGFFAALPVKYLSKLATFLDPKEVEAGQKMKDELKRAALFYNKIHPSVFSYDPTSITCSSAEGAKVAITPSDDFNEWFSNFPVEEIHYYGNYRVLKDSADVMSIDKGDKGRRKPGVQIQSQQGGFIVCNNSKAEEMHVTPKEKTQYLRSFLTEVNNFLVAEIDKHEDTNTNKF